MFIENVTKHMDTFNIHDEDDRRALENLLNNPAVQIVDKARIVRTLESRSGDSSEVTTEINIVVEWEECHL